MMLNDSVILWALVDLLEWKVKWFAEILSNE